MIDKVKFDKWFLRYYWKMIVTIGYLFIVIILLIFGARILEFAFFTVIYVAYTWQVFIERGD